MKDENEELIIQPRFCDINIGKKYGKKELSAQSQIDPNEIGESANKSEISTKFYSLIDEPGIPELETLYYDVYDYDSGEYKTMSKETRKIYEKDVKTFYKYFTGNEKVPEDVKSFSQIVLKDYHNSEGCKKDEPTKHCKNCCVLTGKIQKRNLFDQKLKNPR